MNRGQINETGVNENEKIYAAQIVDRQQLIHDHDLEDIDQEIHVGQKRHYAGCLSEENETVVPPNHSECCSYLVRTPT